MSGVPDSDNLITTSEVASLLGRHQTTVLRMVARGLLEPVKKIDRAFMFRRSDIAALGGEEQTHETSLAPLASQACGGNARRPHTGADPR